MLVKLQAFFKFIKGGFMKYFLKNLYCVKLAKVTKVNYEFYDANTSWGFDCDVKVSFSKEPNNKVYIATLQEDSCLGRSFNLISRKQTLNEISDRAKEGEVVIYQADPFAFSLPPELDNKKLSRRQIKKLENEN